MYVLQATYPVNFMSKRFVFFLLSFLISQMVSAQSPEVLEARKYVNKNAGDIVNEFTGLLALPNVAVDPAGQQKNAAYIMDMMNRRGIQMLPLLFLPASISCWLWATMLF